jgi:hypothetical protein
VPEYDAFGREIGEDTLSDWRTSPAPAPPTLRRGVPEPPPVASAPPHEEPPQLERLDIPAAPPLGISSAPPATARRARRRRPRVVSRLIILLVVLVVGGNVLVAAVTKVQDVVDGIPDFQAPGVTSPKPAPVGLQPGSLIRPAALAKALNELARRDLGRLQTLRLAPEGIIATLVTRRTTLVTVQLGHDGKFQRFGESGGGYGHLDTIPYAQLNPRAPQRLVRAAAAKLNRPVTQIDYLVPSISSGQVMWGAYFKGGAIFFGDARGHLARRIS